MITSDTFYITSLFLYLISNPINHIILWGTWNWIPLQQNISSLDCLQHFIKYLLLGCLKIHIAQNSFKMENYLAVIDWISYHRVLIRHSCLEITLIFWNMIIKYFHFKWIIQLTEQTKLYNFFYFFKVPQQNLCSKNIQRPRWRSSLCLSVYLSFIWKQI